MERLLKLRGKVCTGLLLLLALSFTSSCQDEVDESDLFTFVGKTAYSYMQGSEEYSDYAYILTKVKLSSRSESNLAQLLSARGNYTVFAPTNEAIRHYLDSIYLTTGYDITQIPDSTAEYIAKNSIVDCENDEAYLTADFLPGVLDRQNLEFRYITIDFDTIEGGHLATMINNRSRIVQADIEVSNGVIHGVNNVLLLSRATLPSLIGEAPNMRIFSGLLERTGWAEAMQKYRDDDYEMNHAEYGYDLGGNLTKKNPEHRFYGYTAFVEKDSVFNKYWGIPMPELQKDIVVNWDEILPAIVKKCQEAYPNALSSDLKSEDNAVNQFVAYHLVGAKMGWDKLVVHHIEMGYGYALPDQLGVDCYEYYETLGKHHRLMKLTDGRTTNGKRINRHAVYDYTSMTDMKEKYCDRPGLQVELNNGEYSSEAPNGFYYPIDSILVYDAGVPGVVLNERLRWDISSLLPEVITNNLRRIKDADTHPLPLGYCERLEFTAESRCVYLPYYGGASQSNYQADEYNIRGQYDFTFRLPPVPNEGTYELRMSAPCNPGFGMVQYYIGTNKRNLQPVGLPVDLRIHPENPVIGWESDDNKDEDEMNANDKVMRNHGYMKPPLHDGISKGGPVVTESMRNSSTYRRYLRFRKIVWTGKVSPNDVMYIRAKTCLENPSACYLLDYMEWCPKQVYNGAELEDKW